MRLPGQAVGGVDAPVQEGSALAGFSAEQLVKTALTSAASAAGSKAGNLALGAVLDVVGLQQDDLADVRAALKEIEAKLDRISHQISGLAVQADWNKLTAEIGPMEDRINAAFDEMQQLVTGYDDPSARNLRLRKFFHGLNPLDFTADLGGLHRLIGGSSGGPLVADSFPAQYQAMFWDRFYGAAVQDNVATAAENFMNLFVHLGELQRKAAILAYNCYRLADPVDDVSAASAMKTMADNLHSQYLLFLHSLPPMMAFHALGEDVSAEVGVRVNMLLVKAYLAPQGPVYTKDDRGRTTVTGIAMHPAELGYSLRFCLDPQSPGHFTLQQVVQGVPGKRFGLHTETMVVELPRPPIADPTTGNLIDGGSLGAKADITMLDKNYGDPPALLQLVPTPGRDHYVIRNADGHYLMLYPSVVTGSIAIFADDVPKITKDAAIKVVDLWEITLTEGLDAVIARTSGARIKAVIGS